MRTAQECRKRAEQCLRWAENDRIGRQRWQELSTSWAVIAEERAAAERNRAAQAQATAAQAQAKNFVHDIAENLRDRLALT